MSYGRVKKSVLVVGMRKGRDEEARFLREEFERGDFWVAGCPGVILIEIWGGNDGGSRFRKGSREVPSDELLCRTALRSSPKNLK